MSRVAIYLSDAPPIDRDMIRAVFCAVQAAGDRVVTLALETPSEPAALPALVDRLDDEFDRLLMVVGDDLYEFSQTRPGRPTASAVIAVSGAH